MRRSERQHLTTLSTALAVATLAACASTPAGEHTTRQRVRVETAPAHSSASMDVDIRTRDVSETQDVALPTVEAFDLLPDAYTALGITTVAVVDTSGGVYTVGVRNLPLHGHLQDARLSRYIDCGSAPMHTPADSYDVNFSATTHVTPNGSGSTLHTLVTADARDPAGNSARIRCTSTGTFERRIAELVRAHG